MGEFPVGVADLRSFKKEEILLPPSLIDSLPCAISVGFHLSDAVLEDVENQPTPLYFHHYQRVNILLDTIGLIVASAIQDLGYQAMPSLPLKSWIGKPKKPIFRINMWLALRGWDGSAGTSPRQRTIWVTDSSGDHPYRDSAHRQLSFNDGLRFLSGLPAGLPCGGNSGTTEGFRSSSML